MQMNYEEEQVCISDPDLWCGKTCPEPSPAERKKAKIFAVSWRKLLELVRVPVQCLDLTPGSGDLLGQSNWEDDSPWLGDVSTLNAGVSPKDAIESSLSQILERCPPTKYYLSQTACLGILRRARERGKELPSRLKRALEIQAGLRTPDGEPTDLESYHINQRDEGINLNGISGALMATTNQQMQTFVTQEATQETVAFAANQRDEVRNLHDVASALGAQPGMKQQTFVASVPADATAVGFDGYNGDLTGNVAATLGVNCGMSTGRNGVIEALCINDQGGERMDIIEEKTGTLLAQSRQPLVLATQQGGAEIGVGICPTITASAGMSGNNQPVLYENHGIDSRYTGPLDVSPTMSARYGTGGNNVPLVEDDTTLCIMGNAIDREPHNGGNGLGVSEDVAYTLTATDHHAIFSRQRVDEFKDSEVASTESARQHKDATDLVCYGQSQFANYSEGISTLRAQGGDHGGGSENLVTDESVGRVLLIRRLTPLECERLQGFPDGWTDLPDASDAARYKALGNSVAIPCVDFIIGTIAQELRSEEMQNE